MTEAQATEFGGFVLDFWLDVEQEGLAIYSALSIHLQGPGPGGQGGRRAKGRTRL